MRPLSEQERMKLFQEVLFENATLIELRTDGVTRPGVVREIILDEDAGTISMSWLEDEKLGGEPRHTVLPLTLWHVDRFSNVVFFNFRRDVRSGARSLGDRISESVLFPDDDDERYEAPFAYQYNIVT